MTPGMMRGMDWAVSFLKVKPMWRSSGFSSGAGRDIGLIAISAFAGVLLLIWSSAKEGTAMVARPLEARPNPLKCSPLTV